MSLMFKPISVPRADKTGPEQLQIANFGAF